MPRHTIGEWINEFMRQSLNPRNPSVLEPQLVKNVLALIHSPVVTHVTIKVLKEHKEKEHELQNHEAMGMNLPIILKCGILYNSKNVVIILWKYIFNCNISALSLMSLTQKHFAPKRLLEKASVDD